MELRTLQLLLSGLSLFAPGMTRVSWTAFIDTHPSQDVISSQEHEIVNATHTRTRASELKHKAVAEKGHRMNRAQYPRVMRSRPPGVKLSQE